MPQPCNRAVLWGGLVLGVLLAAGICVALATQVLVVGSRDGGWTYPYVRQLTRAPILVAAGVVPGHWRDPGDRDAHACARVAVEPFGD